MARRRETIRPINGRIARLRQESVGTAVKVSGERATLITEFYSSGQAEGQSVPVQRALAFKYLMERVSIPVEDGQLIVGLRGTGPNEVPTFPEISTHTMADLEALDSRSKMPYKVDGKTMELYRRTVIPFWNSTSMRDLIFSSLSKEWKDAYEAGIFTEFMEQRAPGHTAGGRRIYEIGVLDLKNEIHVAAAGLNPSDPNYSGGKEELKAMEIAADAIVAYANRYATKLEDMAGTEPDEVRKDPAIPLQLERHAEIERAPAS